MRQTLISIFVFIFIFNTEVQAARTMTEVSDEKVGTEFQSKEPLIYMIAPSASPNEDPYSKQIGWHLWDPGACESLMYVTKKYTDNPKPVEYVPIGTKFKILKRVQIKRTGLDALPAAEPTLDLYLVANQSGKQATFAPIELSLWDTNAKLRANFKYKPGFEPIRQDPLWEVAAKRGSLKVKISFWNIKNLHAPAQTTFSPRELQGLRENVSNALKGYNIHILTTSESSNEMILTVDKDALIYLKCLEMELKVHNIEEYQPGH